MNTKKLVKWGVAFTSALVLGGVIAPVGGNLANTTSVVYAQDVLYYKVQHITWDLDNTYKTVLEETFPIYPGETKTVSSHAKKIDGWHYDASEDFSKPLTYSDVLSGSQNIIAVVYFRPAGYKPVEQPTETPTDQPVEKPAETPTEQPVEKPADQPVEKTTEADNTASKAHPVATTDKKKVDNSTPSTNAIKPQEGSQATAKTLPRTGDSSSMLLVLGGLLSGLSGLGLVAPSRKQY